MEDKIKNLENKIDAIIERNRKVEADKAWEGSMARIVFVSTITYIVALVTMLLIDVPKPFLNAFIPVLGFILSTQSLPFIKKWWINKNIK